MDDLARMERALKAAADAGDVQAAQALAREMRSMLKAVNPTVDAPPDFADEARRMTAKETGAGEAALIGAGRSADKVAAGVKQGFFALPSYPLTEDLNRREQEKLASEQAENDATYRSLQKEHPIATAAGEAAPYVAAPASMGVIPSALTVGGVEALKYGPLGERLGRGSAGALTTAAGGAAGKFVGNLIAPVTKKAAGGSYQAGLEAAERIGYRPTLGESTGSSFIRRMEDYAARAPGGSGVMAEHEAGNVAAVNRAAAKSVGETADEMTPEVFAQAQQRLGQVFEGVKKLPGRPIQIAPEVGQAADEVLRTLKKSAIPGDENGALRELAEQAKVWAAGRGKIDGETYQLLRSKLSQAAFDADGTDKVLYGRLLEALDASADASLRAAGQEGLADALKAARPQYANLKLLEKGATAEAGNVSPARVASTMRTQNPGAFRRGQFMGPLGDVARVGETLKPLRAGSPTFERDAVSNPLSILFHSAFSYPIARAATSPVATIYPRTLGKTAGARALSEIANPSTRAAVAAALQQSGALPLALQPVRTE